MMACNLLPATLSRRSWNKDEINGWIFIKYSVHRHVVPKVKHFGGTSSLLIRFYIRIYISVTRYLAKGPEYGQDLI